MRAKEFIKEARRRHDPTTDIRGELTRRNPSGEVTGPWGTPTAIDLENDFMIVDNTKLPKMKFRKIIQNLIPLDETSELWSDLEGNPHDTKYYHVPGDENDIVASIKEAGAHNNFTPTLYIRKDVWGHLA